MGLPNEIHPFLVTGNDANQYKIGNSLRFRSGNSAYLSRTPASVSSRTTWTISFWVKRGLLGNTSTMFGAGNSATGGGPGFAIGFNTSNQFRFSAGGGVTFNYNSTALFRDTSSWYHFVVVWDSTNATTNSRIRVWVNNSEITSWAVQNTPTQNTTLDWNNTTTNYVGAENDAGTIVKFDGYMTEIYSIDGQILSPSYFGQTDNLTNQWVPKRYTGTYGTNGFYLPFNNTSTFIVSNLFTYSEDLSNWAGTYQASISTNATTAPNGATTADKLIDTTVSGNHYVSKSSATLSSSTQYTISMYCKAGEWSGIQFYEQIGTFAANFRLTGDGSVLYTQSGATATIVALPNGWYRCSMTFTTGSSQTIYQGSFSIIDDSGSNSFAGTGSKGVYLWGLQISPGASAGPYYVTGSSTITTYQIGQDISGSSVDSSYNNWPSSNFSLYSPANTSTYLHDSYIDSPTSYEDGSTYNRANYATFNPLSNLNTTLNSGNLYQYYAGSWSSALATIGVTSGKWYMEAYQVAVVATNYTIIGVAYQPWATSNYLGSTSTSYGFQWTGSTSYKYFNGNGGVGVSTPGGTASAGSILQLAFDADTGNLWYGLNNTWAEGSPSAGTGASHTVSPVPGIGSVWFMGMSQYGGNASAVNFGQRPFSYTPPTGFKALNSYNLPQPSLPLV